MNRDDIIRMAREAWLCDEDGRDSDSIVITSYLEHFAALVAAAEREGMAINSIHSCHSECQRPICVLVREAVAAEREACAKVVEQAGLDGYGTLAAALLVRERGAP